MTLIALDIGKYKTGFAVTDESETMAFPKDIVDTPKLSETLKKIIKEYEPRMIVLGHSVFEGEDNEIMKLVYETRDFIRENYREIPTTLQDESFTSMESRKLFSYVEGMKRGTVATKGKSFNEQIDNTAAMLILERYLAKNKKPQIVEDDDEE